MKSERKVGKTPNGGDYSEIFYMDKDHNLVEKERAEICIIRECKENGQIISEIIGFCNGQNK